MVYEIRISKGAMEKMSEIKNKEKWGKSMDARCSLPPNFKIQLK